MEGVTKSGFEFSVPDTVRDNMELIDALAELSAGDPLAMSSVCRMLLGDEQRKKLYDHLRTDQGNVPIRKVETELIEIVNSFGNGKNLLSSPA